MKSFLDDLIIELDKGIKSSFSNVQEHQRNYPAESTKEVELDEFALERGGHKPAPDARRAGFDIPELRQQRWGRLGAVDLAADDLEGDQEPLLVVDDLGLRRVDGEVLGRPIPLVAHPHAQGERHRGFLDGGVGVVAVHLYRQKIVQKEQRSRLDIDRVGHHLHLVGLAAEGVAHGSPDEVERPVLTRTRGAWSRDDQPVHIRCAGGSDGAGPVDAADVGGTSASHRAADVDAAARVEGGRVVAAACHVDNDESNEE